ncbi:hypothetical protein [Ructibacterium gallinarum]|uniref:Uncharacterized protein n=1 Tax=Ructibacterium gallinarum TaxID=2779355 RepID=A0A9D5M3E8_9FIRM|nr:hypothetical protein [Ructibacterium gallinarum]MBE5039890.1 hypothetical protein [Ructibacterium gallinarum]
MGKRRNDGAQEFSAVFAETTTAKSIGARFLGAGLPQRSARASPLPNKFAEKTKFLLAAAGQSASSELYWRPVFGRRAPAKKRTRFTTAEQVCGKDKVSARRRRVDGKFYPWYAHALHHCRASLRKRQSFCPQPQGKAQAANFIGARFLGAGLPQRSARASPLPNKFAEKTKFLLAAAGLMENSILGMRTRFTTAEQVCSKDKVSARSRRAKHKQRTLLAPGFWAQGSRKSGAFVGKRRSKEADAVLSFFDKTELSKLYWRPVFGRKGLPKSDGRWPQFLGKRRNDGAQEISAVFAETTTAKSIGARFLGAGFPQKRSFCGKEEEQGSGRSFVVFRQNGVERTLLRRCGMLRQYVL